MQPLLTLPPMPAPSEAVEPAHPVATLLPPAPTGVEALLGSPGPLEVPADWWSWTGAHGGLVVAAAAAHGATQVPDLAVRGSTAQLLAPVRSPLTLSSSVVHAGRTLASVRTEGVADGRTALVVTTTLGREGHAVGTSPLPAPAVAPPEVLDRFEPPGGLVPFAGHVDVRPIGDLPLSGAPSAVLTAWVRLVEDTIAPDWRRLLVLADALAPSVYATQTSPLVVPTVELSVHLRALPAGSVDPWVLVQARTDWSDEGWITERIDVWDRSGAHLATGRQLRLVV